MRSVDTMPVLDWQDGKNAMRAKFQVMHEEPVVLKMPADMDWLVNVGDFGCTLDDNGMPHDCEGGSLLQRLAELNDMPGLEDIAKACAYSSSRVDIEAITRVGARSLPLTCAGGRGATGVRRGGAGRGPAAPAWLARGQGCPARAATG